ncbi:hypothetical protein [Mesorhizobium escarrei]|uniref:hypothetical protein n=1 Tax=Mesorhizobium escarrei TaxID=666018 RepID=UPI0020A7EFEB|nr:hypothetical protein [Mesorhizobium escarrei]
MELNLVNFLRRRARRKYAEAAEGGSFAASKGSDISDQQADTARKRSSSRIWHVLEGITVQGVFEIGHEDVNCGESRFPRQPPVAQVCPNSAYPKAEILRCGRGLELRKRNFSRSAWPAVNKDGERLAPV